MKHLASPSFWKCYEKLPKEIQLLADKNYQLLKTKPQHPSLHYKKVGNYCSIRIGKKYRAIGIEEKENVIWFWLCTHSEYDKLLL